MVEHSVVVFEGGGIGAVTGVAGWLPTSAELEGEAPVGVGARYSAPLPAADRLDLGGIGEKISAFDDDRPTQKHSADRRRVGADPVAT
jgi:hypothetical protein